MTFEDVLTITRRRLSTILAGLLLGIVLSFVVLWMTPVTYTASAVAYVRVSVPSDGGDQRQTDSYYAASQLASQKVKAFVPVFTSESVAQGVIDALDLRTTPVRLSHSISAKNEKNALTIDVSASAASAEDAQAIADETIRQADAQIKRLDGEDSPVGVALMSPSRLSGVTRSPSPPKYIGAGVVAGVLIGYSAAFILNALDKRVRSQSDVGSVVDEPVLAIIPRSAEISRSRYTETPDHKVEEALRKLRTNLRYTNIDKGLESVLVTSPVPGLQIIPAGDIPPNPSELLGSTRMSDLLSYLASDHVVIVDAPPVLPVTDAVALAEHTDGVLLVIRSGSTTEDQLRQAAASIRQGGGTVLGIALNQVPSSAFDRLRYGETVYGYAAADRIPSSHPATSSRTSPPSRPSPLLVSGTPMPSKSAAPRTRRPWRSSSPC